MPKVTVRDRVTGAVVCRLTVPEGSPDAQIKAYALRAVEQITKQKGDTPTPPAPPALRPPSPDDPKVPPYAVDMQTVSTRPQSERIRCAACPKGAPTIPLADMPAHVAQHRADDLARE